MARKLRDRPGRARRLRRRRGLRVAQAAARDAACAARAGARGGSDVAAQAARRRRGGRLHGPLREPRLARDSVCGAAGGRAALARARAARGVERHARSARLRPSLSPARERCSAGSTTCRPASVSGSEDCLYLNVYAPRMEPGAAAQAKLPVLVWIHGGSNVVGLSDFYDGGRLAQSQDVDRRDAQLPAGSPRLVPPRGAARRRVARRAVGQLRDARSGARARVGARQRGRLRRRSGQRHDLRRVGGRPATSSRCCSRRSRRASSSAPSRRAAAPDDDAAGRGRELPRRRGARAIPARRTRCWRGSSSRTARRATRPRPSRRSRRCRRRRSRASCAADAGAAASPSMGATPTRD